MAHQEQWDGGIRLLGNMYGPRDVWDLVRVTCATVYRAWSLLWVECGAPKAALVEREDDKTSIGPALVYVFVARAMFDEAVDEDDDAA